MEQTERRLNLEADPVLWPLSKKIFDSEPVNSNNICIYEQIFNFGVWINKITQNVQHCVPQMFEEQCLNNEHSIYKALVKAPVETFSPDLYISWYGTNFIYQVQYTKSQCNYSTCENIKSSVVLEELLLVVSSNSTWAWRRVNAQEKQHIYEYLCLL